MRVSAVAAATVAVMASPLVSASATAAPGRTGLHVDAGGSTWFTQGDIAWFPDRGFRGGTVSDWPAVAGSAAPRAYGSVRYGMDAYDLPVADGRYDVTLRMVEPWHDAAGERRFDVSLEGRRVLDEFDVYAAAGGKMQAVDRTFQVDVTGGNLDIDFSASVDYAIVSAISAVPVAPATTTTAPAPAPKTQSAPAPKTQSAPAPKTQSAPVTRSTATATRSTARTAPSATVAGTYPFGSRSVWRQSVANAPVHSNSDDIVRHLHRSITSRYGGVATFNATKYNSTYYVVDADTPRRTVKYNNCQGKDNTFGLYGSGGHFVDVPIPSGAVAAAGTDGALAIYSPSTDQLWEFWKAEKRSDGWYACWGGRIDSVSTNVGHFEGNYGTTASGLPHAAGQISLADVRAGKIEHAMALLVAQPRHRSAVSWPAQRSDGWVNSTDAVPLGMRLRLDPSVDVDALDLHPIAEMIARAAQTYGFIAVDASGATGVYAESGLPEEKRTGTDPWKKLLAGTPQYEVMENFPWDELEAMPMHHGKP